MAIAMFAALPTVAAHAAEPDPAISFEGAGWGHGVGMSQYGAYGRALEGQTYDAILMAYYTGATLGAIGVDVPDPGPLFTNVGSDMTSTVLTIVDGPTSPRTGMVITQRTGEEVLPTATLFTNDTVSIVDTTPDAGNPGGCVVTLTVSGVETVWESGTCDVSVQLANDGTEPEHLVSATNCRRETQCTYGYGTALHVVDNGSVQRTVHDCIVNCAIGLVYPGFDLVVESTLGEYVRGVAEVPYSWPTHALMTQAVAARSYAASFVVATDHTAAGCFCDVKNSSAFQVYAGWNNDWPSADRWREASTSTAGQVVAHPSAPDAGIVRAYYSSSNGGTSEWVKDKWGADLAYLVPVADPWSLVEANPLRSWTLNYPASRIVDVIWGIEADYRPTGAHVIDHNASGSAKTVRLTAEDENGSPVLTDVPSETLAPALGLYSWYFTIDDSSIDNGAPVITLLGEDPTEIPFGLPYVDAGATAIDDIEGDISAAIIVGGLPVDTSVPGDYVVTYDVSDGTGNSATQVTRTVTVAVENPSGTFLDDDDSIFEDDIEWLAKQAVTNGCGDDNYCPSDPVTRGQMAAFLKRALEDILDVDPGNAVDFTDTAGTTFESDIDWLSASGVTRGCGPDTYCPTNTVTRGQMAAFLHRAFIDLIPPPVATDHGFTDVDGHPLESDIQWLADTGITSGCAPDAYCPNAGVTRGQMAAFIHRAFDAAGLD